MAKKSYTQMDIGIFIKNSKGTIAQIPINPSEFTISSSGNNKNMEIVKLGEISILKKSHLKEIEWESWFPYFDWYPGIRTSSSNNEKGFKQPDWYVKFIEKIRKSCKPCQLIITGLNINMDVSIEDFSTTHKAGEHEDKYYSIKLKEYRPYSVSTVPPYAADYKRWGSVLGSTSSGAKSQAPKKVTVGAVVVLDGKTYSDSKGSKVNRTYNNYVGKCTAIDKKGKYPYFIQSQTNRWLGWVSKKSLRLG